MGETRPVPQPLEDPGQGVTFRASLGLLKASVQHQLKGKRHVVDLPRKPELVLGPQLVPGLPTAPTSTDFLPRGWKQVWTGGAFGITWLTRTRGAQGRTEGGQREGEGVC